MLVVEDDPEQRRLLRLVLEARGHDVVECATAAEARAAEPCEISLVDRRLSDEDGLELARSLDGQVFLLTGDDELDSREAGVPVLLKPVRPSDLDELLP